jgi:hypothetical protein
VYITSTNGQCKYASTPVNVEFHAERKTNLGV